MPKLPTNVIRRKDRAGYWFRGVIGGRLRQIALGADYPEALRRWRSLKTKGLPRAELTVSAAANRWLECRVATARNQKGQRLAHARVERWLVPFLGGCLLCQLGPDHVRDYRLHLERQRLSAQSVAHLLSDLRCLLLWCIDSGWLDASPFPRRVMPTIQQRPPDRLTDEDAQQLRELPAPYGFVCRLALGSGMRWGELTRAQASDVDRQGFLVVHHQTKNGKVRRVPLEPELLAEVRRHVGRLVGFATLSPGSFAAAVRKRTGIAGFHVHQMRHTFACQWLERGRSLPALQQVLGHASIETTQRYARLTDEAVMREVTSTSVTQSSPGRP